MVERAGTETAAVPGDVVDGVEHDRVDLAHDQPVLGRERRDSCPRESRARFLIVDRGIERERADAPEEIDRQPGVAKVLDAG